MTESMTDVRDRPLFARPQAPLPRELFIFPTADAARNAGFVGPQRNHVDHRDFFAWWPDLGVDQLRGQSYCRVTISDGMHEWAYGSPARHHLLGEGLHAARMALRLAPMIWIEL